MWQVVGLTPAHKEEIKRFLTVENPAVAQAIRYSGWAPKDIPKFLVGYQDDGESLWIAPGIATTIKDKCNWLGYQTIYPLNEKSPPVKHTIKMPPYGGELRSYQEHALEEMSSSLRSCCVAPCGSGKTDIALHLISARHQATLILVHMRDLRDQWESRIKLRLGIDPYVLKSIKHKDISNEPIIIATVQFLVRHSTVVQELAKHRSMVIVDEAHHTPCSMFTKVLAQLNPLCRHGFTATDERDDGLSCLMRWWIGPIVARIDRQELEEQGYILKPKVEVKVLEDVLYEYNPDEPGDHHRCTKAIELSVSRLCTITNDITDCFNSTGGTHLVLASHIPYLQSLAQLVAAKAPEVCAMLIGPMGKKARAEVIDNVKVGKTKILFATSIADEGLDMPSLNHIWLVSPTRSASRVEQRVGRICRMMDGKSQPIVHDFVDINVWRHSEHGTQRLFVNQFKHRLSKVYRRTCEVDEAAIKNLWNLLKEKNRGFERY
jgi:superfamily II DNA or RNA helicase